MSSVICLNLDQSKFFLSGNGLKSKLKAIPDDKLKFTFEKMIYI